MIFAPDPELKAAALAALRTEYNMDSHRDGLHQSELQHCLTLSYWDRVDPLPPTEKEVLLFAIGFGMERVLLSREITPEPLVVDGITLSLDTVDLFGPADLKTTRLSPQGRKDQDGFQLPLGWRRAFMAYARAKGVQEFGIVVYHLIQPELKGWKCSFSAAELEENWQWYLQRANDLENMRAAQAPEPYQHNEDYECTNCRYSLRCGLQASLERMGK